mmetsp:Transcript_24996/g.41821  ORF Transcript_24996/g.41821 Transcript_24996/m.41821 type:complete len:219 (+) Transcript_24996:5601-6257(+)
MDPLDGNFTAVHAFFHHLSNMRRYSMPSLGASAPPNAHTHASTNHISKTLSSALLLMFSGLSIPSRMYTSVVTQFIVARGVMWLNVFFISKIVLGTYFSISIIIVVSGNCGSLNLALVAKAGTDLVIQEVIMLRHWVASEMYKMPARVAVAGVANFRSRISKMSFMWGSKRMRSLDGSVSRRLSSMVEFMLSIQLASRSPSSRIHLGSVSGWLARSRM